jgi:hypothetical protein
VGTGTSRNAGRSCKKIGMDTNYVSGVRRAVWSQERSRNLHDYFQELVGISIRSFDAYSDLEILQLIGNVLRHGDGPSAERLHDMYPRLWLTLQATRTQADAGPLSITVPADAAMHPSICEMTTAAEMLDHLMQVVCWFWEDIEYIRCNSFKRKHPSTIKWLAKHLEDRKSRKVATNRRLGSG